MLMDEYRSKLRSAEEAVKVVKNGDWVYYSHFAMFPKNLDRALAQRVGELEDVSVCCVTGLFPAQVAVCDPEQKSFTYYSPFFSAADRRLSRQGLCFHIPTNYWEDPVRMRKGYYHHPNVAMVKTTSMDEYGFFNFGTSCSSIGATVENADVVIVEVNPAVPRCLGGHTENVHLSKVDMVVEVPAEPLPEIPNKAPSETDVKIAETVVKEIPNGACLQLGIGAVPNTIGHLIAESDLHDLGVHSEMMCDAFLELYNRGKITNRFKSTNRNKMVFTFALGSRKLYEFLNNNPACATYPVDYTNVEENIAANDNTISINNALQVDLYGQVCSGALWNQNITGTGGQLDFTIGATRSKGGKAFICLHSTREMNGRRISHIMPQIEGVCTVPRSWIFNIVTEFGTVCLKGKSTWEIAEAVISVAHPDFREGLIQEAQKRGIWKRSNKR